MSLPGEARQYMAYGSKVRAMATVDANGFLDDVQGRCLMELAPRDAKLYFDRRTLKNNVVYGQNYWLQRDRAHFPGRFNYVLSHEAQKLNDTDPLIQAGLESGKLPVALAHSIEDVVDLCHSSDRGIWLIGGASTFDRATHCIAELHLFQYTDKSLGGSSRSALVDSALEVIKKRVGEANCIPGNPWVVVVDEPLVVARNQPPVRQYILSTLAARKE